MQKSGEILCALLQTYPELSPLEGGIARAVDLLVDCYERQGLALICGNGGSAADAEHIVGELMKGFLRPRPLPAAEQARFLGQQGGGELARRLQQAVPAVSLVSHGALLSAFANDVDPELVYAQQVYGYGRHGQALVIALSTSGNSSNVVRAAQTARALGLACIAITGEGGGALAGLATVCLRMPASETYRVQEYTLPVYHALCAMAEARCFTGEAAG